MMDSSILLMRINDLPPGTLQQQLLTCCASRRWVQQMMAGRPYQSAGQMVDRSNRTWPKLFPADWLEAFIAAGKSLELPPGPDSAITRQLATLCLRYEAIFGYPLVYSELSPTADQLLFLVRQRLEHDPAEELLITAEHIKSLAHRRMAALAT